MLLKFLLIYITTVKGAEVFYSNSENNFYLKNVNGPIINEEEFPEGEITKLTIFYYHHNESEEIKSVSSFSNLIEFTMVSINQTDIPKFSYVPELLTINIFGTHINVVRRYRFNTEAIKLILKNNKISRIENGAIGNRVQWLNLGCNQLTTFNRSWFESYNNLKILNLRGNKITVIQSDAFKYFPLLKDINLSYNYIHTIGSGAFKNGDKPFDWIFLHNNNLEEISENIFGYVKIRHFLINSNNLTYLSDELLNKIDVIKRFDIDDNPWSCPCYKKIFDTFYPIMKGNKIECITIGAGITAKCKQYIDREAIKIYSKHVNPNIQNQEEFCDCSSYTDECFGLKDAMWSDKVRDSIYHLVDNKNKERRKWMVISDGMHEEDENFQLLNLQETPIIPMADIDDKVFFYYSSKYQQDRIKVNIRNIFQVNLGDFIPDRKTIFIIHGWNNGINSPVNDLIRDAVFQIKDVYNVWQVDWSAVQSVINYPYSAGMVPMVGELVANFIKIIMEDYLKNIIMVGHSLGAHVCGKASSMLNKNIAVIVGLDPAKPYFTGDPSTRLDYSDAHYVEIIHTNAGLLGLSNTIGHGDYFPNGGSKMPGCGLDLVGTCSHSRSYKYYAESINKICTFWSLYCSSYNDFKSYRCARNPGYMMGQLLDKFNYYQRTTGIFYLRTRDEYPFCMDSLGMSPQQLQEKPFVIQNCSSGNYEP